MQTAGRFDTPKAREAFLREHVESVYASLTGRLQEPVRVEELVYLAADRFPGLVPTRREIEAERQLGSQGAKRGLEVAQGEFLAHVLAHPGCGLHLVRSMLQPRPEARALIDDFQASGRADLDTVSVERRGAVSVVELRNLQFLNAEDDRVVTGLETAVDLVLLDRESEVGVLRGGVVDHPRHAGRRIFNSGLNLTHLWEGRISFVDFMIARELGLVAKLLRGHSLGALDSPFEDTLEKPWIAAVESWAIGGGCQLLLVVDRVLAERSAYFSLPARREGLVPGVAPRRLARLAGGRLARQASLFERSVRATEPAGGLLCDEVVEAGAMDAAIERAASQLTSSGAIAAAANRKAIRLGEETLDEFRLYMAMFAREQVRCLYSPAVVRNLDEWWLRRQRER